MKKSLGQFLILLIIISCYINFITSSDLNILKSNIHYVKQNENELNENSKQNINLQNINNVKNATAIKENSFIEGSIEIKNKEEEERFERYVKSLQCSDNNCRNELLQLKNEFNINFPEIENFEKEEEKPIDVPKHFEKRLLTAEELNERNTKFEEFQKQGLSESEIEEKFNIMEEKYENENEKKKQDQKKKKMAKRINGNKTAMEIQQEILNKGTLNSAVYGTYTQQKRMWYFNKQLKWRRDYFVEVITSNNRKVFDYKIKVPIFMKEIDVYLQCNFQITGDNKSSRTGYKARLKLGKLPIGNASKVQDLRYVTRPWNNHIAQNAILSGKVFNVPAGEHVISLFVDRIGTRHVRFMDDVGRVDALLNITGFPNY